MTSCPPVTSVTTLLPDAVPFCGPGGVCFSLGILRGTVQSVASAVSGPGASCPGVSFSTLRPRLPMKEAGKKAAGPRPGAGVMSSPNWLSPLFPKVSDRARAEEKALGGTTIHFNSFNSTK